jgi:hypothetical protein
MTRAAHRPVTPPPPIVRTPTQLRERLYQAAGEWENTASLVEISDLARTERRGASNALRVCADELVAILEGRDE